MKHIKSYKIFESNFEDSFISQYNRIEPELNDILLPFNDDNIKYQIYQYSDDYIGEVTIFIEDKVEKYVNGYLGTTKRIFTWNKIKEEILHVISFMDSEGIEFSKLEVQQYWSDEFHNIEMYDESDIEELEDTFKFTEFNITFSKTP
jgi:hypothetical protein